MDSASTGGREVRIGRCRGAVVLGCLLALIASATALAAGVLRGGFGRGGLATIGNVHVLGLATQKDGRVVVVGYSGPNMLVMRLGTNGSGGTSFHAGRGVATAAAVQGDGKIVVAGRASDSASTPVNGDMVLKRFNANGSPDRAFGSGGTVRARGTVANAVSIGPGGVIVLAGAVQASDGTSRVALARFRPNGARDNKFGSAGFAVEDLGRFSVAYGVRVQSDGKIVFAGDQRPDLRVTNALIARVTASGRLDTGFARRGVYLYLHPKGGAASSFRAVALDSAGRIVAGGGDVETAGSYALFARLSKRGAPDPGFGSGGVITAVAAQLLNDGELLGVRGIAIARRGEIVATGVYKDGGRASGALWAITAGGRLDRGVGSGGLVKTALGSGFGGEVHAVAVAPSGQIYSGGDLLDPFSRRATGFVASYSGF